MCTVWTTEPPAFSSHVEVPKLSNGGMCVCIVKRVAG